MMLSNYPSQCGSFSDSVILFYIFFTRALAPKQKKIISHETVFGIYFHEWNQRIPFDWHNPIGYYFAIIWQSVLTFPVIIFFANMIPLGIGAFLFALSFAEDWKVDLQILDEMVKTKQPKADIFKQVTEFVRSNSIMKQLSWLAQTNIHNCHFYSISCILLFFFYQTIYFLVKRLIKDFEDLFKVCIFADVLCCGITLCVVMLTVQVEIIVE